MLPRIAVPCSRCRRGTDDPWVIPCRFCRGTSLGLPLIAAGWHERGLRALLLRAKWRGDRPAVEVLADLMIQSLELPVEDSTGTAVGAAGRVFDAWCAVPRDRWRWLRHGVPLSELLGSELGGRLGVERLPPPRRRRRPPQTRHTGSARRTNLIGAFYYPPREAARIRGRRVILVDDVATTGSTLDHCARAILAAGATHVSAWVAAAVPSDGVS